MPPPFKTITQRVAERREKAAERAANPPPTPTPEPAPAPPPPSYEEPMPVRVYPR